MEKELTLEISTYQKVCLNTKVRSIIIPAQNGLWGIMKGHANTICLIKPGIIYIEDENGKKLYSIGEGVCQIENNKVYILTRSFERKEEIDREHLESSYNKLLQKIKEFEKLSQKEQEKVQNSLQRNLARRKLLKS
jgi:ATP synthase F1 epsilon subunit